MSKCYFELRKAARQGIVSLSADIMRHLHTRQYLGKNVIICEHPAIFLATAYKQWLRLSRDIQQQRAETLDADKILKYTHLITHMQHMRFTTRPPQEEPDADLYFILPEQLQAIPQQCYSVYLATRLQPAQITQLLTQLPLDALVVDYTQGNRTDKWQALNCQSKRVLELHIDEQWRRVEEFLAKQSINISNLFEDSLYNIDVMDNALDALLAQSRSFLQIADDFCRALELARPSRVRKSQRRQYDVLTLLAHRVQALSGASFTKRFLEMYSEDDEFFLYDSSRKRLKHGVFAGITNESLAETIARHIAAGRYCLAEALGTCAIVS